ncbi:MAG TPA: AbrB/MazE/SpoVT family DNA-binding domain-containing protein [archaeon]|nr:AbrB/MazE/SpoVT family DNA-binding domain-containing protein [archaeon]
MKILFTYKESLMEKKFEVASVSTRGQITIPQDIREMEQIREGDKMIITYVQGYVVMKKLTGSMVTDFFETMRDIGKHVDWSEIKKTREKDKEVEKGKTAKWTEG